jgi:hypothetical protein
MGEKGAVGLGGRWWAAVLGRESAREREWREGESGGRR